MDERCPRCRQANPDVARFSGRCGLSLEPGVDGEGNELFAVEQVADELPRSERMTVEITSYDIPSPPERQSVALVSAVFVQIE